VGRAGRYVHILPNYDNDYFKPYMSAFGAIISHIIQQFTPVLAQLYSSLNKKGKKFEVVWLSRDRSSDEFLEYYQKMPWLAVTLQNVPPVLEKLAPKYELKGIPHLVILDGDDASVITLDGRTAIAKDPYGLEYPWRPRTLLSLLPKPLKRLLKAQLEKLLISLKSTIRGALEGLAPGKVLNWIMKKLQNAVSEAGSTAASRLKEKLSGADAGQGTGQGRRGHSGGDGSGSGSGAEIRKQSAQKQSGAAMDVDVVDVDVDGGVAGVDADQDSVLLA
jgi:Thioredoxin-like